MLIKSVSTRIRIIIDITHLHIPCVSEKFCTADKSMEMYPQDSLRTRLLEPSQVIKLHRTGKYRVEDSGAKAYLYNNISSLFMYFNNRSKE